MHFLSFSAKRAYYATLATGRQLARHFGLTPARFDLLYAAHSPSGQHRTLSAIRAILGVARATISRMLARLESLGLVRRTRSLSDRRTLEVRLTEEGLRRLRRTQYCVSAAGYLDNAYEGFYESAGYELVPDRYIAVDELNSCIRSLARHFGDRAMLHYPGDPMLE